MTPGGARAPVAGPSAIGLAVAGSATVATAFGMARYGYGLLLPDIKDDLALPATALGAIGTLGYVTYVAATALVTRCIRRAGERATVTPAPSRSGRSASAISARTTRGCTTPGAW